MATILSLLGDVKGWLALLGAGLLAAFAAYLKGRSAGKASERTKQTEAALESRRNRDEIDDAIGRAGDADARERLRKYARDGL